MARTTAAEVKVILNNNTIDNTVVDAFITGANLVVTAVLGEDTTIGASLLIEIEKWFTAHMIASTPNDRSVLSEKLGDAAVKYTGQFRENLSSTPYGQMVMTLDTTGKMQDTGKRTASIEAITSFD